MPRRVAYYVITDHSKCSYKTSKANRSLKQAVSVARNLNVKLCTKSSGQELFSLTVSLFEAQRKVASRVETLSLFLVTMK
jgi:hypothetical protein